MSPNEGCLVNAKVIIKLSAHLSQISKIFQEFVNTDVLDLAVSLDTLFVIEPASINGHLFFVPARCST